VRTSLAAVVVLGLAPAWAAAQTPEQLLKMFRPSQKGVEYDTPTDKAAVDACKVETVHNRDKKPIGYALRDGQGQLLRKFVDNNGKKDAQGKTHLDQWSYYKDGFEVYREVDTNEDGSLDECWWLNSAGTRVALLKSGKVVGWKRLSAEEASKVLVQALVYGDPALLDSVLATPEELERLGVPKGQVEQTRQGQGGRAERVAALRKALTGAGWDAQTVWYRFDGMMPHVIPADAGPDLKEDLTLYENAA